MVSKTLVRYVYPFDVRFSGYLVISNHERINDQFVYYPSRRKVVRVNLRSEAVFGTDFCYEDVIPREIEESDYERVADETVDGMPVYVVEVVPKPFTASEYSRVRVYVEKERFVPLRTRYWDARRRRGEGAAGGALGDPQVRRRLAADEGHHAQPAARLLHHAGGFELRAESGPAAGDLRPLAPRIALSAGRRGRPG